MSKTRVQLFLTNHSPIVPVQPRPVKSMEVIIFFSGVFTAIDRRTHDKRDKHIGFLPSFNAPDQRDYLNTQHVMYAQLPRNPTLEFLPQLLL